MIFRTLYYKLEKNSLSRFIILQVFLILLALFNTMLNLLPFHIWKIVICNIVGIKVSRTANICNGVRFLSFGKCQIGDRTIINRDCLLDNRFTLSIGDDVSIATGTRIFTQGHDINSNSFELTSGAVHIENNVCIFAGVMIMPGVTLSQGCVVLPGSLVSRSVDELSVVGGVPAKKLKQRKIKSMYKLGRQFWYN
jgi:acetyltransferase-like isoleucine patch superfamily enzyme